MQDLRERDHRSRGPACAPAACRRCRAGRAPRRAELTRNLALDIPIETPGVDSERTQLAHYPPDPRAVPFPIWTLRAAVAGRARAAPTGRWRRSTPPTTACSGTWRSTATAPGPFSRGKLVDRVDAAREERGRARLERTAGRAGSRRRTSRRSRAIWRAGAGRRCRLRRRRARPAVPRRRRCPPIARAGTPRRRASRRRTRRRRRSGRRPARVEAARRPGRASDPAAGCAPRPSTRARRDPSSLLETPAPQPHMMHARRGDQRRAGQSGTHAPPKPVNSDVLQMLNMPGRAAQTAPGAPPRLMSLTDGWRRRGGAGRRAARAPLHPGPAGSHRGGRGAGR